MERVRLIKAKPFRYRPRNPKPVTQRASGATRQAAERGTQRKSGGMTKRIMLRPSQQKAQAALVDADPLVTKLLADISLAKEFERVAWKRLADHLASSEMSSG